MELVLQDVQTVSIAGAGAELGDVKTGSMWHVDHEGVGEDHQVVLLQETGSEVDSGLTEYQQFSLRVNDR